MGTESDHELSPEILQLAAHQASLSVGCQRGFWRREGVRQRDTHPSSSTLSFSVSLLRVHTASCCELSQTVVLTPLVFLKYFWYSLYMAGSLKSGQKWEWRRAFRDGWVSFFIFGGTFRVSVEQPLRLVVSSRLIYVNVSVFWSNSLRFSERESHFQWKTVGELLLRHRRGSYE